MLKKLTILALASGFCTVHAETYNANDLKNGKGIRAEKLTVSGFIGNLEIKNRDINEIVVQASGSDDYLQTLVVESDGDSVKISHKNVPSSLKTTDKDLIVVEMPSRFPVNLSVNSGSASIQEIKADSELVIQGHGDIKLDSFDGKLKTVVQGSGDVKIGNLNGKSDIQISGSGDIEIGNIHGKADIQVSGSGGFDIEKGQLDSLKLVMSGSGDFSFDGDIKDADLNVSGSGKIKLNRVSGTLNQKISGSSSIDIKNKG